MILDDLPEQLWGQEGRSQPQLWFGENRHGSGSSKAGMGWSICFEDEESTRQGNCLMHVKGHRQRPSPEHEARLERRGGSLRCSRPQEFWGQRESEPVGPAPLCDSSPRPAGWGWKEKGLGAQSGLALCDAMDLWPARLLSPRHSPGKNTGVDSHPLLQGIFPTQGSHIAGRFFTIWATRKANARVLELGQTPRGKALENADRRNQARAREHRVRVLFFSKES